MPKFVTGSKLSADNLPDRVGAAKAEETDTGDWRDKSRVTPEDAAEASYRATRPHSFRAKRIAAGGFAVGAFAMVASLMLNYLVKGGFYASMSTTQVLTIAAGITALGVLFGYLAGKGPLAKIGVWFSIATVTVLIYTAALVIIFLFGLA